MTWWALDIHSPPASRDAVAAWLVGRTGRAVLERADGMLVGATHSGSMDQLLDELQSAFGASVSGSTRCLPQDDWSVAWREGLAPRRIGRLVVTQSWHPAEDAAAILIIDPANAFGTGEHGSTRTALLLLDRLMRPGDRVLDVGSGSGVLAIAAVKLGASRAIGVELDPEALPVALANAERNGVTAHCHFITGDALGLAGLLGPADFIVSNILRSEHERLLPTLESALAPGGVIGFAGIEEGEGGGFRDSLQRAGFGVALEVRDHGWWGVAVRHE